MLRRITSAVRRTRFQANQRSIRAAAIREVRRFTAETLEQRVFLSVSAQTLEGPIGVAGNSWTYQYAAPGKASSTGTLTSQGTVKYGDQQAIEIESSGTDSSGDTGTEQIFYGNLPQGIVILESAITASSGPSEDTVWSSPYYLIAPTSLDAGVPFTTPTATATQTVTSATGVKTTTTHTKSDVITLATATPSVAIEAAGTTYMCYEVDSTDTNTVPGNPPTTSTTQTFVSPTVGLVQIKGVTTTGSTYSYTLTKFTGTSYQLAVRQQPTNTLAGDPINPTVQIALQDGAGNVDTNASDAVTVTASIAPGSTGAGTLTGNTATTVGGVATFSNLSINKPGQYTLNFADSAGRTVSSVSFQVSAGKLVFVHPVKNGIAGSSLDPVEVELEDSKGHKITDAPSLVTLNISGSNSSNPITGNMAELVGGTAVFNGIKLAQPGTYTLSASDAQNDATALSNQFEVAGPHLVFTKEPSKVGVGEPLRYVITLKNSKNNTVTNSNDFVELSLNPGGGANGTLSSVSDILSFGVADNSDKQSPISINTPGDYTLTATLFSDSTMGPVLNGTEPVAVTSKEFQISADKLKFTKPVLATNVNIPLAYQVTLEDYKGEKVAGGDKLQFNLITVSGGSGAVLAGGADSLLGGVANNTGGIPRLSINVPGTYKLAVIDVPPSGEAVAKGAISGEFKVK